MQSSNQHETKPKEAAALMVFIMQITCPSWWNRIVSFVNYEIQYNLFQPQILSKALPGFCDSFLFVNCCISKCHQQAFNQHATSASHVPSNSLIHLEIEVQRPRNRRGIPNLNAPRRPPTVLWENQWDEGKTSWLSYIPCHVCGCLFPLCWLLIYAHYSCSML